MPGLWNMLWLCGLLTRHIHENGESTMRGQRPGYAPSGWG